VTAENKRTDELMCVLCWCIHAHGCDTHKADPPTDRTEENGDRLTTLHRPAGDSVTVPRTGRLSLARSLARPYNVPGRTHAVLLISGVTTSEAP